MPRRSLLAKGIPASIQQLSKTAEQNHSGFMSNPLGDSRGWLRQFRASWEHAYTADFLNSR